MFGTKTGRRGRGGSDPRFQGVPKRAERTDRRNADPTERAGARGGRKDAEAGEGLDIRCDRRIELGRSSRRTAMVGIQFGLPLFDRLATVVESARVRIGPGRIVAIVGPSGSGKSSALGQISRQSDGGCMVQRVTFPAEAAIIDRVAPWGDLSEALGLLTVCGLGDANLWVRRFVTLSDGEKFRARLARGVAQHSRGAAVGPLMCDEFCSSLHRRVARAISFGLRKLVKRRGLALVLACSQEDVIADLQPHAIVRLLGRGRCEVEQREVHAGRGFSLRRRLKIEPGRKVDYDAFAAMHYRATDELGFVDKVFVMREGAGGEPLGIVVYAHAPLELRLRNEATGSWFSRNPGRVNRSLRILRRLIIHPDVRGCGLGHYLVKKTLSEVGTKYVECLASMGEFNPVFERAGMQRIGQYEMPKKRQAVLDELEAMGVDPNGRDFPMHVSRRRLVREIVARVVFDWYSGTTGGGAKRVQRQSPHMLAQTFRGLIASRPVYYLWRRP